MVKHWAATKKMLSWLIIWGGNKLRHIYRSVLREKRLPTDWWGALTVLIYKKWDMKDSNNYRGITLLWFSEDVQIDCKEGR